MNLFYIGVGDIGTPLSGLGDGEGPGIAVPVCGEAQKTAEVVGHGEIGDIAVEQQGVLGCTVLHSTAVERHRAGGGGGGQPFRGSGGRGQSRQQDAAEEGAEDASDFHGGQFPFL